MSDDPTDPGSSYIISEAGSTPRFEAAYGRAMGNWGLVESALCQTFIALIRPADPTVAALAFFAITSFRDKTACVSALLDAVAIGQDRTTLSVRQEWISLSNAIGRAARNRNKLAHLHFWLTGQGIAYGAANIYETSRLPIAWKDRDKHVITEKQLRDYAQGFLGLRNRLEAFADQCRRLPTSP